MTLPPALVGKVLTPAVFSDGAKFGNYLGGLINRIGGRATREPVAPPATPPAASGDGTAPAPPAMQ